MNDSDDDAVTSLDYWCVIVMPTSLDCYIHCPNPTQAFIIPKFQCDVEVMVRSLQYCGTYTLEVQPLTTVQKKNCIYTLWCLSPSHSTLINCVNEDGPSYGVSVLSLGESICVRKNWVMGYLFTIR